jgi:hypothetical protein
MDREGLNAQLRDHLSSRHDIETQERRGFRAAEHRREEQAWAPEPGTPVPPRPEGIGDWTRKALGTNPEAGGKEEWAHGQGYPAMMERPSERSTATPPPGAREGGDTVTCPICGRLLMGSGESDLSNALEDHFRDEHRIVPSIAQR